MKNILIGVTGSVATVKLEDICKLLSDYNIKVVATDNALNFITREREILTDKDEWDAWKDKKVLHLELRNWADILLIAPLNGNTMAKIANGLCDNLLTCVVRAWDWSKPVICCPAMNNYMWESPFTSKHLEILKTLGIQIIHPIVKKLACGDVAMGSMENPQEIVQAVMECLK